jgi:hypothetical protein
VQITVSDSGPGIPESELPYVFTRKMLKKYVGQKNPLGHGLGLFICKEIVEEHKGKIWVESHLGRGTKMIFDLPLDERSFDCGRLVFELREKIEKAHDGKGNFGLIGFQINSPDPLLELESLAGKTLFREYFAEILKGLKENATVYQIGRLRMALLTDAMPRDVVGEWIVNIKKSLMDLNSGINSQPFAVKSAISKFPDSGKTADVLIAHLIKQLKSI